MSEKMYELRDILCEELDKIADKGELSTGELDTAHKLTDTIKNIDKIMMLEEDGGYSRDGEWEAMGNYNRGNSYRGRSRDSMGRYSRTGDMYSRRGRYSRTGEKEAIERQLDELMNGSDVSMAQKQAYKKALDIIKEV